MSLGTILAQQGRWIPRIQ